MPWIVLVAVFALLQFSVFGALVGRARGRYGVHAPATTGHEMFERYYRVQYNTLEQIVVFLPALFLSAGYGFGGDWMSAALGAVYLIAPAFDLPSEVRDPNSRGLGFGLTVIPVEMLLFNAGVGAAYTLI